MLSMMFFIQLNPETEFNNNFFFKKKRKREKEKKNKRKKEKQIQVLKLNVDPIYLTRNPLITEQNRRREKVTGRQKTTPSIIKEGQVSYRRELEKKKRADHSSHNLPSHLTLVRSSYIYTVECR